MGWVRKRTRGRIVVGASFMSYLLSSSSVQFIGAYMPALSDELNVGSAVLGWICSFGYAMQCLSGPVAGMIINNVEPRYVTMTGGLIHASGLMLTYLANSTPLLYLSLGILPGFGSSLVYVSAPISVAAYFTSHYSTAIGFVFSGIGVGIFLLSPLIEQLIVVYGWRGAILIHGALVFNVFAMGALIPLRNYVKVKSVKRTDMNDNKHNINRQYRQINANIDENVGKFRKLKAESEKRVKDVKITNEEMTRGNTKVKWYFAHIQLFITSPTMVLVYLVTFFINVAYSGAVTHSYNQIVLTGHSETKGALALSLLGVGSLLGRLFQGIFIDTNIVLPSTLYLMTLIGAAVATFINPLANNYPGFVVSATGIGFMSGILFPLLYTIMRRKVGTCQLATAMGLELLIDGLGIMIGGYLAGAFQQLSGDYRLSFYVVGAIYIIAACFFLPVRLLETKVNFWMSPTNDETEMGTPV